MEKHSYMTDGVMPVYTGNRKIDGVVDKGIDYVISKVPNKYVKYGLQAFKQAAPTGAKVARGVTAYREACSKKK